MLPSLCLPLLALLAGQRHGGLGLGFLGPHAKCFVVLFSPFVVVTRSLDAFFFFSLAHAIIKIFLSNCFLFLYVRSGEGERETGHSRRPGIVQAEFEQGSKGAGGHTALAITMSASSFVAPEPWPKQSHYSYLFAMLRSLVIYTINIYKGRSRWPQPILLPPPPLHWMAHLASRGSRLFKLLVLCCHWSAARLPLLSTHMTPLFAQPMHKDTLHPRLNPSAQAGCLLPPPPRPVKLDFTLSACIFLCFVILLYFPMRFLLVFDFACTVVCVFLVCLCACVFFLAFFSLLFVFLLSVLAAITTFPQISSAIFLLHSFFVFCFTLFFLSFCCFSFSLFLFAAAAQFLRNCLPSDSEKCRRWQGQWRGEEETKGRGVRVVGGVWAVGCVGAAACL